MFAILLLIILQSLSSVLCLNCSDVRQSNGFGIFMKRDPNGGRLARSTGLTCILQEIGVNYRENIQNSIEFSLLNL